MTQTTQSSNIINEGNKKITVAQGWQDLLWGHTNTYWDYTFHTSEKWFDKRHTSLFRQISRDFVNIMPNNVVMVSTRYCKLTGEYKEGFGKRRKWTPPKFKEDGGVNRLKNQFKEKQSELLWTDCLWYELRNIKLFDIIPTEQRLYFRKLSVILNRLDCDVIDEIDKSCVEDGLSDFSVTIYPHKSIECCENKEDTLKKYLSRKDFICNISMPGNGAFIIVEPNPTYMSYEDVLENIVPLFEKMGFYIEDKTNPYIKNGFAIEHNTPLPHKYSGFEFFD